MEKLVNILIHLSLLILSTTALSTTIIIHDGHTNNASVESYVKILTSDGMAIKSYEADTTKTLETIRSDICRTLEGTKNLKMIVDYSRIPAVNSLLDSITQQLHVPHVRMSSSYQPDFGRHNYQLQVYPGTVLQLRVLKDFLKEKFSEGKWRKGIVILPENSYDLKNYATLVQDVEASLVIRKWSNSMEDNDMMLEDANNDAVHYFIVALELGKLNDFFALASSKQMMGYAFNYLLTSPMADSADLLPFAFSGATITAFSADTGPGKFPMMTKLTKFVKEFTTSLKDLSNWNSRCSGLPWADGEKAMSSVLEQAKRKTNLLKPENGIVSASMDYLFNVMSLTTKGFVTVSYWQSKQGFKDLTQGRAVQKRQSGTTEVIRVVTLESTPFVIYRTKDEKGKDLTGNERYTGMSIEIFKKVAEKLNWKYDINIVSDKKYGAENRTNGGSWNGMIGALTKNKADIAVGDLTITYSRSGVVAFSSPYMNLGVTVLLKKPKPQDTTIDFCAAFKPEVWVLVLFSLALASLALFATVRLSPLEWYNSNSTTKVNNFTLQDCFWFVSGASLFRGTNLVPRAIGPRLVAFVWWVFVILLVVTYAITMQSFIPKPERMRVPITTVGDLAKQTTIRYGAVKGGSTSRLFQTSDNSMYKTMYEFMVTNPDAMVNSTRAGIERVLNGNGDYAFIVESSLADYYTARNCDLLVINEVIHPRSFGFAMQKDSKLISRVSDALLSLQEKGDLERTKMYWLYQYRIAAPCESKGLGTLEPLSAFLMTRLFVGLVLGLIIAIIACVIEIVLRALRPQERGNKTVSEYLVGRMRLVFCTCSGEDKEPTRAEDEQAAQPALSPEQEVTDKEVEKV